jgi:NADH-ubiquinone oxidoreductase chain 6
MDFLFYFFSSLALLAGIMVIQSRNPVHSVLFLILVFFNAAGLLILLGLDFFAMIFLVVYVGAIAVLFLFVVMMLNIKLAEINEKKLRYLPVGGLLGILFLFEIFLIIDNDLVPVFVINSKFSNLLTDTYIVNHDKIISTNEYLQFTDWYSILDTVPNIQAIGMLVYTYYFYFFLLASLILLVAMIGAIVLTMHKSVHVIRQEVFKQNTREFAKTVNKIT